MLALRPAESISALISSVEAEIAPTDRPVDDRPENLTASWIVVICGLFSNDQPGGAMPVGCFPMRREKKRERGVLSTLEPNVNSCAPSRKNGRFSG